MDKSPQIDIPQLLSRATVANMVRCHVRTVARAEQRGELKAIKLNSRLVRYDVRDVAAWIGGAKK
jgi:hypothetical protein